MKELMIENKVIKFESPTQIINMGGPWVGIFFIGELKIMDDVIIDNIFYSKEDNRIYFVKYHKVSRWEKENYFTINYFDLSTNNLYMFDMKFEMLFLKEISNSSELIYYIAFHDRDESKERRLNLCEVQSLPMYN